MFSGPLFGLIVAKRDALEKEGRGGKEAVFGFIVSTKVSKQATARNRARRLLREAARSFLPNMSSGMAVVVLAKQALLGKDLPTVKTEMERLLKKAGILTGF